MVRRISEAVKQYCDKTEPQQCVLIEWQKIELYLPKSLADSIQNRCVRVVENSSRKSTQLILTILHLKGSYRFKHAGITELQSMSFMHNFEQLLDHSYELYFLRSVVGE